METILEQQRRHHEERERIIDCMVKEMIAPKKTVRAQINSETRLKILLDRSMNAAVNIKELYEDKDGQRQEEIKAITGPNEFAEFYARLKVIKEFHRKHPNEISVPLSVEFDEFSKPRENPIDDVNLAQFTDEESYGKFLDLHECYTTFTNLKGIPKIDYISYLSTFDQLFDIAKDKKNAGYREYLQQLIDYLESFYSRVKPLHNLDKEIQTVNADFVKHWKSGQFPGWPKEASGAMMKQGAHLELSAFTSWEELASLGLDRLKSALMALNLKCGGLVTLHRTLEERAQRLFMTKGKNLEDLPQNLFVKSKPKTDKHIARHREIANLEAVVYRYSEILGEQRTSTKDNVQRRQARTGGEREDEAEEEAGTQNENINSDDEDDDDDIPYNPKNLPLGWDGKPIPYWLYKLHGLNMSYTCEICGNFTYRGPKTFQRHFSEWRHAHGMRCLSIPNTAHFANVTFIEDAIALWSKIKEKKEVERFKADVEEEFEDTAGNVVNRRIFDDLKRQGLL